MAQTSIFYAWTTASEPFGLRGFVRDCIDRAIASLGRDAVVHDAVRDTSGAPSRAGEDQLERIAQASLMIADVTAIADGVSSPDVLFELGNRAATQGPASVILIANTACGRGARLPLVLQSRSVLGYQLDRADRRGDHLVTLLAAAIDTCLHDSAAERAQRHAQGVDALARILVYGTDLDDHDDGAALAEHAQMLLALARDVKANVGDQLAPDSVDLLDKAIVTLDRTAALPNAVESWPRIRAGIAAACSNIELGPREWLKAATVDASMTRETLEVVRELARWSTEAAVQFEDQPDAKLSTEQLERFDQLTYAIRRFAEFPVVPEHPSFVERLHPIAVSIRKAVLIARRDGIPSGRAYLGCAQLARDELTSLLAAYASVLD